MQFVASGKVCAMFGLNVFAKWGIEPNDIALPFENNPKCRLINPAKRDSGKIKKLIFDKINTQLRTIFNVNQWQNKQNVIDLFGNIQEKN